MVTDKIKILFLSHTAGNAGAEQCLFTLIAGLDRSRFQPFVVIPHEKGWLRDSITSLGIPIIDRATIPWIDFRMSGKISRSRVLVNTLSGLRQRVWGLAGIIERENIDIVHTNTVTHFEGALAARAAHCAHIWHIHESLVGNNDLTMPLVPKWLIEGTISYFSDRVVGVSETLLRRSYPRVWESGKAVVVYNGVDLDLFKPDVTARKRLCDELGLNPRVPLVATIGGLRPVKDYTTFLKAAARIDTKAIFLVVGEGSERSRLEQLTREAGISKYVRFLGARCDIHTLIPALDLLVISSKSEAFPLTAIEAMASGIPVVATRCGGVQESVVDEKTGLLVEIGAVESMAKAMDRILHTPGMVEQYGKAGRERAESLFGKRNYITSMEHIFTEVAKVHITRRKIATASRKA